MSRKTRLEFQLIRRPTNDLLEERESYLKEENDIVFQSMFLICEKYPEILKANFNKPLPNYLNRFFYLISIILNIPCTEIYNQVRLIRGSHD